MVKNDVKTKYKYKRWISFFWGSWKYERNGSKGVTYFARDPLRSYFNEPAKNEIYFLNIYSLGIFTEKPYSKPLGCNVVYIPIITLSHATSHDFKWRQNKPWLSTLWLDVGDAMKSLALFRY